MLLLLVTGLARADSFIVEDIEVIGIKKISLGTVLSYLPVNVGESFDVERTPEIIRELYSTGFFDNIELYRRGNVLVIAGGVFIIEAVSVILQVGSYKLTGKRIFRCAPIHHHFQLGGWKETQTVVRFWLVAALFAGLALITIKLR